MDSADVESLKRYVGFDSRTTELLARLHGIARPSFPALVDDFYAAIEADPETRTLVTGGTRQLERLRQTLYDWLDSGLRGPHEEEYAASRRRIGLVHVRIGLPQRYMLAAMNRIRGGLLGLIEDTDALDDPQRRDTVLALQRLLDLELALMLDSYYASLAERIRDAERLATIGQLTASIGHELRNPLAVMESSLYLAKQALERLHIHDPLLDRHNEKMLKQVALCKRTITHLLDLARDRPPARQRTALAPLVRELADELDPRARLDADIADDVCVDVDRDDLGHVLQNLFVNSVEAASGSPAIAVSAERVRGGTEIVVVDDGPGVPPERRGQIFDALFTTKARGNGLGLSLCRRIVHAYGGEIELVPSERGAKFRVWFPDVDHEPG